MPEMAKVSSRVMRCAARDSLSLTWICHNYDCRVYEIGCVHEHIREVSMCQAHRDRLNDLGCADCCEVGCEKCPIMVIREVPVSSESAERGRPAVRTYPGNSNPGDFL